MIYILDSSVALRWFLKEESHPVAEKILKAVMDKPHLFAVPELFCFEMFSVLHRLHPEPHQAFTKGVLPLIESGVFRQPMTEKLASLALPFIKKGLTGYDACYAAMAKDFKGLWLTFDKKAHNCIKEDKISCLPEEMSETNLIF